MGRPKRTATENPAEAPAEEGPSSPKQPRVENESDAESTKKDATKTAPKRKGRNNSIAPAIEHAKKYFEEHEDGCEIICSELLKNYENKHPCYNYFSNKLKDIYGSELTIIRAKGKNARDHTLVFKKK